MANVIQFYFNRAKRLLESKQYQQCINTLTKIIDSGETINQEKANVYLLRGIAYFEKSEYDNEINDYAEAIPLFIENNDKAKVYASRGNAYREQKKYNNAIADFTKVSKLYTKNNDKTKVYFRRGSAYEKLGEYEKAIALYTKNNDKAIADYTKAIELYRENNNKTNAYFVRGITYNTKGEYDNSIADYQESITLLLKHAYNSYGEAKTFYKFCPANKNTLAMLIQQQIYFSDIASLNDPLECPLVQKDDFFL